MIQIVGCPHHFTEKKIVILQLIHFVGFYAVFDALYPLFVSSYMCICYMLELLKFINSCTVIFSSYPASMKQNECL